MLHQIFCSSNALSCEIGQINCLVDLFFLLYVVWVGIVMD